jgi:hypothetical protein
MSEPTPVTMSDRVPESRSKRRPQATSTSGRPPACGTANHVPPRQCSASSPPSTFAKAMQERMNAVTITPSATMATFALPSRRPMIPFTAAPRSGSTMMSHR